MADKKPANKATKGFTDDERAAMRERAQETKAAAQQTAAADDLAAVLDKIAAMSPADRAMAENLHVIITTSGPDLTPRLWYGMPAYAKDGDVICFFQSAHKFKTRYSTLGFSDKAALDDGAMWPTSYALTQLTATGEESISALVKKAVS